MSTLPDLNKPTPYIPPPSEAPRKLIPALPWTAPLRWLTRASADLITHPGIGFFYGAAFTLMALVLQWVFAASPEYTMSMACGCLLLGPFLAMGLYEVSRCRELGQDTLWQQSALCWRGHLKSMSMLLLVLVVLELLWGRASLVVFAVFFNTGMPTTTSVVAAIFAPENWDFVLAYTVVGGAFAGIVYAVSVVAIPMILDRDTDAISASIVSLEVVFTNSGVMLLWGALIVALIAAGLMMPWHAGLLVVGPLLGHASWHAYRANVVWLDDAPDVTVP